MRELQRLNHRRRSSADEKQRSERQRAADEEVISNLLFTVERFAGDLDRFSRRSGDRPLAEIDEEGSKRFDLAEIRKQASPFADGPVDEGAGIGVRYVSSLAPRVLQRPKRSREIAVMEIKQADVGVDCGHPARLRVTLRELRQRCKIIDDGAILIYRERTRELG